MKNILLLQGPNLNKLGSRDKNHYGTCTLADIERIMTEEAQLVKVNLDCFQSNHEGELIDVIHASESYDGVIYNPGAHTHYSYALRDAIECVNTPFIEVHLSDIHAREPFRAVSVIAPVCQAQIAGKGLDGYLEALHMLASPEGISKTTLEGCAMENTQTATDLASILEKASQAINPASRIARIREVMREQNLDAMFVRNLSDIGWITAFDSVFDTEHAHSIYITAEKVILHTDSRYSKACVRRAEGTEIIVDGEARKHSLFAREALEADFSAPVRLGIEDSLSLAEFHSLEEEVAKLPFKVELVETTPYIVWLRAIKDEAEITRLRAAQAITDAAFTHICGFIKPGMTEREIQIELEGHMYKLGAQDLAFSSIVASGPNGADPHAIPGSRKVAEGECIVIDFGAKVFGYCSDMTRTVFVGEPSDRLKAAWTALEKSQRESRAAVSKNITGAEVDKIAHAVLDAEGWAGCMGHSLGHGVGMDVHEEPCLAPRNTDTLAVGSVVTVEPGIYIGGEFGMRLEDFGVVTEDGFELFTQSTHEMVILK